MLFRIFILFACLCAGGTGIAQAGENPFEIPFPAKKELTAEDFIHVQNLLRKVDIHPILGSLYAECDPSRVTPYGDFWSRSARGLQQELINPEKNLYPKQELFKIGLGGDGCVVCCAPFSIVGRENGTRAQLAATIKEALSNTGFNGYFLLRTGGFPNPTGEEIRYAGVPYAFKIFMMVEAYLLGFTNVIWIDSACLPLNDPTPLFDYLNHHEALLHCFPISYSYAYILPQTRQSLIELTGTDVLNPNCNYIFTIVFGLKMDSPRVQRLIKNYYTLVEKGYPFFSCFPEEFVLTAIMGKPDFKSWKPHPQMMMMFTRNETGGMDTDQMLLNAKNQGYYFYQRKL